MSLQQEILKDFRLSKSEADVVRELESICNLYSLTPGQLKMKWEAFALSSQVDLHPTVAYVQILKSKLQREFERGLKTRKTVKGKIATKRPGINYADYGLDMQENQTDDVEDFMSGILGGGNAAKTTATSRLVRQAIPLAPTQSNASLLDTQMSSISSQFINRKATHVLETQHNSHLPLPTPKDDDVDTDLINSEFTFEYTQPPIEPYRFMFEKLKEKSEGMDDRIEYVGSLIEKEYNLEAFGNPTRPGQEAIYAYGLIKGDRLDADQKLNEKSILLQTSRDLGMGRRVALDLSKVDSYTLFPGQIIGVKGTNHTGSSFHVEEILMPPLAEKSIHEVKENKTLDLYVAAGPFTLDDDLSFKPFEELLSKCTETQPDALVLMGPFISMQHPKIKSGVLEAYPEQIFRDQVLGRLEQFLMTCSKTNVFILPHKDDMLHPYPLFPQPPLPANIRHDRIHFTSNPAHILLNGHTLSMVNMDVLFKLGKEEISKNPAQVDRFSRLTEHILQQHSYYPLLPHAPKDSIDASRLVDFHVSTTPDILIMPSQFKHFVKQVNGGLCINPGTLCKHQAGGTYARIILHPNSDVNERVRVDLFKL